jgi:transposase
MEVRLAATTPTACDDAVIRILIAIELSKKSWIVGANTPLKATTSRFQLAAGDWQALLELIEELRHRVARERGCPVFEIEVISCFEAGYDGFWLHRLLEAHGVRNNVLDPSSLLVNRRAKFAKTDGIDVERMLRALGRHLRGEPDACSVVRIPSVEEEDAKRLHRERRRLVSERVQHVNRIKGLCALHGIYDYRPLRTDRKARLEGLRTGNGHFLPPRLKTEILRELQRLELVLQMIADVEAERDAIVKEAVPQHPNAVKIKALAELSSIGPEFATRLVGEVFYRSFDNRRQLASFAGIAPSPWSSGSIERDQGISKAGSSMVRTTMIELGWLWLRYQPASALSIWFRERVGDQKGRVRRIAIVALARKLLVALWRYLETGLGPCSRLVERLGCQQREFKNKRTRRIPRWMVTVPSHG